MGLVKFVSTSAANFGLLEQKDSDTLYFVEDERRLYRGNIPYSGGIYQTVGEFPGTGNVNTLYVNTATGEVAYWNGTGYQTVVPATGKTISGAGDNDHIATTKAVVDYVVTQIGELDVSALARRVDTLETEMDTAQGDITTIKGQISTINGEGEGSIKKALNDAKTYTDQEVAKKANLEHTHEIDDVTGLQTALDGKANKATTLAGYGIADAYTKGQADSAIAAAVAAAPHLKRSIVEDLPDAGSADQNTIYMVGTGAGSEDSAYEEYMLINGAFERIGTSDVDLTNYAQKTYVDSAKQEAISTAATDATQKANTAEQNAKTYADGLIAGLDVEDSAQSGKYVSAVAEVDGKIQVTRADLPAAATLVEGTANGTVKFNGTDVPVHGLKSAAYTDASDYATAAQGGKADTALQKADITTGSANGTISVDGDDVTVKGLGSAAYTETTAYATAAQGTKADQVFAALTWTTL